MQHVNLYTEEFRPKPIKLNFEQMLLSYAVSILLIIILTVWASGHASNYDERITQKSDQRDALQSQLDEIEASRQQYQINESIQEANLRLKQRAQQRERMLNRLSTLQVGESSAYSDVLVSLARQGHADLWLTNIQITGGDASLELKGQSKHPSDVPQWLAQLKSEDPFVGRSFSVFDLLAESDSNTHAFILRSTPESTESQAEQESVLGSSRARALDALSSVREGDQNS